MNTGGKNLHRNVVFRGNAAQASLVDPCTTLLPLGSDNPPALQSGLAAQVSVPTFYIAGSLDATVTRQFVKARFLKMVKARAGYGQNVNPGHVGFARKPSIRYFTRCPGGRPSAGRCRKRARLLFRTGMDL